MIVEALDMVQFSGGFEVELGMDALFPLFTPEGEVHWAEGWAFEWIGQNDEGLSREGAMFATLDARGRQMIWRILKFEAPVRSSYYVVIPGSHVMEVHVSLASIDGAKTRVNVQYVYIPFSEDGEASVSEFTEESYRQRMLNWKAEIEKYLKRSAAIPGG